MDLSYRVLFKLRFLPMDRKEFLTLLGFSAIATTLPMCMGSCSSSASTPNMSVDFTLDLTQSAYAALNTNGGYIVKDGVIVAKTTAGNYVAVSAACTHEGANVNYNSGSDKFVCPRHGATFANSGTAVSGPANGNLQKFNTTLTGNSLRVYS